MMIRSLTTIDSFLLAGLAGYASLLGILVTVDVKIATVAAILPALAWVIMADKKNSLFLFILFLPYSRSPFMSQNLMGIAGMKPFNLLAALTLAACLFHGGNLLILQERNRNRALLFIWLYFLIFTITLFRSLGYLSILHMFWPNAYSTSVTRFLLSYYLVPALYLVPFFYILNHITERDEIESILMCVWTTIVIFSLVFIGIALSHFSIFLSGNRKALVHLCGTFIGLHYNSIGSFYIITAPVLLLPLVRGKWWGWAGCAVSLIALLLLQSRTAIVVFLLSSCLLLFLLNRKKLLFALLLLTGAAMAILLPLFLLNTLKEGMQPGNRDILVSLFNGRIDLLWIPLLTEWFHDPKLLLFGKGRFSMIASEIYQRGFVIRTAHPHNALIELFLDCGLLVFSGALFTLVTMTGKAWKIAGGINSDLGWVLFMTIICFLIGTISGRSFYPGVDNFFLFVTLPLFINYVFYEKRESMQLADIT